MSDRLVKDCDSCKRQSLPAFVTVRVEVGREMDAAGSIETITETLDLCVGCAQRELQAFVKALPKYSQGMEWFKRVKK